MCRFFALVLLAVTFGPRLVAAQESFAVDDYVAQHESTLQALHTIDAHLELRSRHSGQLIERLHWSQNADMERVRTVVEITDGGRRRFNDTFMDATTVRYLGDYDPRRPPRIRLFQQHGVHAWIKPRTRHLITLKASNMLLLNIQFEPRDERRSLSALVREARRSFGPQGAKDLGKANIGSHTTHWIQIRHPGVVDPDTGKVDHEGALMDLYLDPSVGHLARRLVTHWRGEFADGVVRNYTWGAEVVRFQDFGDGVYFPKEVVTDFRAEGGLTQSEREMRVTVVDLSVNGDLSPDSFDFRFPENVLVKEYPAVNGVHPVHRIGADGSIVESVRTTQEMEDLMARIAFEDAKVAQRRRWLYVLMGAIPLLLLALIAIWRRRVHGGW